MSELTYDKLTETEKQIMSLAWNSISGTGLLEQTFIEGLRQIMPPTCTANERKFLDEIREKFAISNQTLLSRQPMADGEYVTLYQSDFESNLKELVNE